MSKIGEKVLGEGAKNFTETPEEMVVRVCRGLGRKKNIIVLNDEAHHCYRPKKEKKSESTVDEARLWINGLEAVKAKDRRKTGLRFICYAVLSKRFRVFNNHTEWEETQ